MHYDEFIGQVQHRARLASRGEAVSAIRATLETFAERLAGREADHLAAQLAKELQVHLRVPGAGAGLRLSLEEFFERVREREGCELPASVFHARIVTEVLQEAVSGGEIADVRAQLPREYDRLLEAGSTEMMPGR